MVPDSRIRRLDGIRGAAVLLVVVYHAGYLTAGWGPRLLPGGFVGVDLFFVLSGFLITRLLVQEVDRSGRIALGRFGLRRVLRLFPTLLVAVVGVGGLLVALGRVGPDAGQLATADLLTSALGTLAYVSNYQQAAGWEFPIELSHTWSLAIEAQFYVLWPLVVLAFHRWKVPRRGQVVALLVAIVAVGVHRALMWTDQAHYLPLYLRTDTRLDVILAGCLLGLLHHWGRLDGVGRWLRIPSLLGVVVLGVASTLSETGDVHLYRSFGFSAVALAATAIVASVLLDEHGPVARVVRWRPLAALGDRSYSLYLWHVPVFLTVARRIGDLPVAVRVVVGVVVAGALTEVSYRLVETRFRRGLRHQPDRPTLTDRLWSWCRAHRGAVLLGAVVVGALPMAVAVAALAQYAWYPIGDLAQAMMRQLSFWSDPPLVGPAGRIGIPPEQGNHPGPAMFWITWPAWWLLGRSSWAYQASVALVVVGAYAAAVAIARRLGGWLLGLVLATVGAVLLRSFGAVALTQPWNPYVPLLPFLVFVVACWATACRRWGLLPVAVAAGSFCVQCHVGYAPAVAAGILVALLGALAPDRWVPAPAVQPPGRRVLAWVGAAVAVGVVMWVPPVVDQLTREPGNFSILLETYDAQTGEVIGMRQGAEVLLTQLDPVGNWLFGTRRTQSTVLPGVAFLAAWAVGVVVAWRRRHALLLRLDAVLAALLACAGYWAMRLDSARLLYLVEWFWVITALLVVSVAWSATLVRSPGRRPTVLTRPAITAGLLGVLAVSTASFTWTAVGVEPPDLRYSRTVQAVASPVAEQLDPSQRYFMNWIDPVALGGNGFGLMLELERRGFDVGAHPLRSAAIEPHRVRVDGDADAVITVVNDDAKIALARTLPGATELAYDDHRTVAERDEYRDLQRRVMDQLRAQGMPELADGIPNSIWIALQDPRVVGEPFDALARMLTLGQSIAVFVSDEPLPGL